MASIEQRGDTYRIIAYCGYDVNGKQIKKRTPWTLYPGMAQKQIEKELERQKVLFEQKCKDGLYLDGSIKFSDFVDRWFKDYADKHLKKKTKARYKDLIKPINEGIGHIKLNKIQPHHLIELYSNLEEPGMRNDIKYTPIKDIKAILKERKLTKVKFAEMASLSVYVINSVTASKNVSFTSAEKISRAFDMKLDKIFKPDNKDGTLSAQTLLHYHRLVSSILGKAVLWQIIIDNPCKRVDPPKVEKTDPKYLDEVEAANLLDLIEKEAIQHKTMIKLLIYSGMRRGELCGLEWSDINFDNKTIWIQRSSMYLSGQGIFEDTTKNYSSERIIKVSSIVINTLKEYRKWQLEEKLKLGDLWIESNRLFTQWNGSPIHPDSVTSWFSDFIDKHKLPDICIHSLRHTNATLLIAAGTPLKTVANRLGHAQSSTTNNIYTHSIKSADEAAAETLEDILSPTKNLKKKNSKSKIR